MLVRLKRSRTSSPGIQRRRRGKKQTYHQDGKPVEEQDLQRIEELKIPPAWEDVWICPEPNGHIQALGVDKRGRKQYLYHPKWRDRKDTEKFQRMERFGRDLRSARPRISAMIREGGVDEESVRGCTLRLLDLGFFRVGSEAYRDENGTYGIATLTRDQAVVRRNGTVEFTYTAKHGKERIQAVADPEVRAVLTRLKRRRDPGRDLLAYREGGQWHDVTSSDVNTWVQAEIGPEYTAKDFRTWHATVLAAVGLAVAADADDEKDREKAVTRTVQEVAKYLGNTPAVARGSYIDPRIIEAYKEGKTIRGALEHLGEEVPAGQLSTQGVEEAVLELLAEK